MHCHLYRLRYRQRRDQNARSFAYHMKITISDDMLATFPIRIYKESTTTDNEVIETPSSLENKDAQNQDDVTKNENNEAKLQDSAPESDIKEKTDINDKIDQKNIIAINLPSVDAPPPSISLVLKRQVSIKSNHLNRHVSVKSQRAALSRHVSVRSVRSTKSTRSENAISAATA